MGEDAEVDPVDPDVNDVFDVRLLEQGNAVWNAGGMVNWPTGYDALHGTVFGGMARDEEQRAIGEEWIMGSPMSGGTREPGTQGSSLGGRNEHCTVGHKK